MKGGLRQLFMRGREWGQGEEVRKSMKVLVVGWEK